MLWQQAGAAPQDGNVHPKGPVPLDESTNMVPIETLIRSVAFQNPNNQTYQAQIWVVNPFAIPLLARVTQPLPPGVKVVSTDGLLGPDSIVWAKTVATNGLAEQSFSFTFPVPPGALTNLPPPTLVLSDSTGTNSLTQTTAAASFIGLFAVGVSNVIPTGTWGMDATAQLAVTNFTAASQAGSLLVSLTDSNGSAVTNFSVSFSVDGLTATNITYTLPGALVPGAYAVTGVLSMGGGSGQLFSGTYVLAPAPVWLGPGSATGVLSDGFTLQVEGTPGYGYLIECSTNLMDWQPAEYLVLTNSPGNFTDYYAPLYSERFYRAIEVSKGP
jgi:hypothetical protein